MKNGTPVYISDLRELANEVAIPMDEIILCANTQGFTHRKDR